MSVERDIMEIVFNQDEGEIENCKSNNKKAYVSPDWSCVSRSRNIIQLWNTKYDHYGNNKLVQM